MWGIGRGSLIFSQGARYTKERKPLPPLASTLDPPSSSSATALAALHGREPQSGRLEKLIALFHRAVRGRLEQPDAASLPEHSLAPREFGSTVPTPSPTASFALVISSCSVAPSPATLLGLGSLAPLPVPTPSLSPLAALAELQLVLHRNGQQQTPRIFRRDLKRAAWMRAASTAAPSHNSRARAALSPPPPAHPHPRRP